MTKKMKAGEKKPYVIAICGFAVAAGLIGWGSLSGNKTEKKEAVKVEIKKKLTENEQFELKPVSDLVNAVKNRFEDETSKNRAQETSKLLIKEFVKNKSMKEVDNWGIFITSVSSEDLLKWNDEQEEKFKMDLKQMAENTEVKNIPVEEIAQNNPLYLLQEKKVIQKELYEQWLLMIKQEDKKPSGMENTSIANENINKNEEDELKIDPLKIDPSKENVLKEVIDNSKGGVLAPIPPIPPVTTMNRVDQEKEKKANELLKVTQELEKAKAIEKDLSMKKVQLNDELTKNSQNLKSIENEIEKTNKDLEKLEKELKALQ